MLSLLASLFAVAGAFADGACKPVRLDSPAPLSLTLAQDQDELNTCYAHVAAQLLDARRGPASVPETTSAFELALTTKEDSGQFTPEWGTPCEAVEAAQRKGVCATSAIAPVLSSPKAQAKAVRDLAYYARHFDSQQESETGKQVVVSSVHYYLRNELRLPPAKIPQTAQLRAWLEEGEPMAILRRIIAESCHDNARIAVPPVACHEQVIRNQRPSGRAASIHALVDRQEPFGITFCLEYLKSGTLVDTANCVRHSAIVLGRRERDGRCELLLRNSWGTADLWLNLGELASQTSSLSYLN